MIEEIKNTDSIEEGRQKMNTNFDFIQKQLDAGAAIQIPQFINFPNAYKGKSLNCTTSRIAIDSIYRYEAYSRPKSEWSYMAESTKKDLGDDIHAIYIYYAKGDTHNSFCAIFWSEKQRDEALNEMDVIMGLYKVKASARMAVVNTSGLGEGMGIVIQELPKI